MPDNVQPITVGSARATIVNVYTIPSKLNELIALPEEDRTPENLLLLNRTEALPVQCILIQMSGTVLLVDAGIYDKTEDRSGRVGYVPPTGLIDRLAEVGVQPSDVDHVVITHAHGDHYNATT
ncbi:MAG TPA: MBL fold metallo-hydrolase, partial [Chloroflexota bacterium]|nr:MBL fold metallo-hydrolase [Chloroflexota bacterium]